MRSAVDGLIEQFVASWVLLPLDLLAAAAETEVAAEAVEENG